MISDQDNLIIHPTKDGSLTFFSQEFNEAFHSNFGAKQESYQKFAFPTQVKTLAKTGKVKILDVCYGLGYNTAAALEVIWQENSDCFVEVMGLEINSVVPQTAINENIFSDWDERYIKILTDLAFENYCYGDRLQAKLFIGDARKTIQEIRTSGFLADAIFLDPFSPPQCPQLWTIEFIENVVLCLSPTGLLATYSCAAAVRTALLNAGLIIGSTAPVGRRTPGTIAAYPQYREQEIKNTYPLSQAEIEHLQTRAAIPYRDPQLTDPAEIIIQRRQQEQENSNLEPTSQWRKRWN
ncbi:MAG: hypothetical protein EAZ87_16085 [Nostocales cyanobacterium]|nr:MAG: hypothetical protein EAZ87_16085 [Nostocales cyanobacterium]